MGSYTSDGVPAAPGCCPELPCGVDGGGSSFSRGGAAVERLGVAIEPTSYKWINRFASLENLQYNSVTINSNQLCRLICTKIWRPAQTNV